MREKERAPPVQLTRKNKKKRVPEREKRKREKKKRGRGGDEPVFSSHSNTTKKQGLSLFFDSKKRVACECAFGPASIALATSLPGSQSFARARAKQSSVSACPCRWDEAAASNARASQFRVAMEFSSKRRQFPGASFALSTTFSLRALSCSAASVHRYETLQTHELQLYFHLRTKIQFPLAPVSLLFDDIRARRGSSKKDVASLLSPRRSRVRASSIRRAGSGTSTHFRRGAI